MFYALYLFVLFHSPNAKFYPKMRQVDAAKLSKTVRSIVTYTTFELISLLYMHFILQRKLSISALHLLANVLERENAILQCVFMTWVIIVLQFTLEHGGVPYFRHCSGLYLMHSSLLLSLYVSIIRSN